MTRANGRTKATVLVVDGHPVTRAGYRAAVSAEADFEVCGEAACEPDALRLARDHSPDLVVMDVGCGGGGGLELCKSLRAARADQKILVVSAHDESVYAERALRAGAMGYLSKREEVCRLVGGMRAVLDGEYVLSPTMSSRIVSRTVGPTAGWPRADVAGLSDRELEVFESIGGGLTTGQIAVSMVLSHKTIETYREGVKRKLGLENAVQLSCRAMRWVLQGAPG